MTDNSISLPRNFTGMISMCNYILTDNWNLGNVQTKDILVRNGYSIQYYLATETQLEFD